MRGRTTTALAALALAAALGCGGGAPETSPGSAPAPATRPRAETPAPPPAPPRRRPLPTPPVDSLVRPLPDRALPDTVGTLMARTVRGDPGSWLTGYLLWLPPGIERGDRRWPLVVYLHGRSLSGTDPWKVTGYGLPKILQEGESIPFVVVMPQAPPGHGWFDLDPLVELIDRIAARYPVDRDRVYATGYSMGGGGTWRLALRDADELAAAIPIAATTPAPTSAWLETLHDLPILAFHGGADGVAPVGAARAMVEALEASGADAELRVVAGAGHGDLTNLYRDPTLYAWLLEHRRGGPAPARPAPRHAPPPVETVRGPGERNPGPARGY